MLRIKDWEKHFENNRTRELKSMAWVPVPNKQDGDGYTELMDHPDGASHYGAWVAIVLVASKCDVRGTLSRDGARPHDAASLSRITRVPLAIMSEAIERLISIGWLERISIGDQVVTEIPQEVAPAPQEGAPRVRAQEGNGKEGNGKEEKGMERKGTDVSAATEPVATAAAPAEPPGPQFFPDPDPPLLTYPCDGKAKFWHLTQAYVDELSDAFPTLDVMAECRKALAWVRAAPDRRKTANGMKRFLFGWLTREQDRGRARASPRAFGDDDPRGNGAAAASYVQHKQQSRRGA